MIEPKLGSTDKGKTTPPEPQMMDGHWAWATDSVLSPTSLLLVTPPSSRAESREKPRAETHRLNEPGINTSRWKTHGALGRHHPRTPLQPQAPSVWRYHIKLSAGLHPLIIGAASYAFYLSVAFTPYTCTGKCTRVRVAESRLRRIVPAAE